MWKSHRAEEYWQAEKVLLGQVQEPVAFEAPVSTELVEYPDGSVPAVWERVSGEPGVAEAEKVLQPRLRKPGESEEKDRG